MIHTPKLGYFFVYLLGGALVHFLARTEFGLVRRFSEVLRRTPRGPVHDVCRFGGSASGVLVRAAARILAFLVLFLVLFFGAVSVAADGGGRSAATPPHGCETGTPRDTCVGRCCCLLGCMLTPGLLVGVLCGVRDVWCVAVVGVLVGCPAGRVDVVQATLWVGCVKAGCWYPTTQGSDRG